MGRKEQVFQKYEKSWPYPKRPLKQIIEECSNNDPSRNNKYLDWMIKTNTQITLIMETQLFPVVKDFHDNQNGITSRHIESAVKRKFVSDVEFNLLKNKPRDINSYPNLAILRLVLEKYQKEKQLKKDKKDITGQYDTILDNKDYTILVPLTHKASAIIGYGTKWCTAMKSDKGHFIDHTKNGILYYIIDKLRSQQNHPLHKIAYYREFNSNHGCVYNAIDSGLGDLINFMPPDIITIINEYHNRGINVDEYFKLMCQRLTQLAAEHHQFTVKNEEDDHGGFVPMKFKLESFINHTLTMTIDGFDDCNFCINLSCQLDKIKYTPFLFYKNKRCNKLDTPWITQTLDSNNIIGNARKLFRNANGDVNAAEPLFEDISEYFEEHIWLIYSNVIYQTVNDLCKQLSTNGWVLKLNSSADNIQNQESLSFTLRCKNNRLIHGGYGFDFDMQLDLNDDVITNTIQSSFTFDTCEKTNYQWEELTTIPKKHKLSSANLIKQITGFVNKLKKHLESNRIKINRPVKLYDDVACDARERMNDWICEHGYSHNNWDADKIVQYIKWSITKRRDGY